MKADKEILFTPIKIGSMTVKNRFVQTSVEVGMADFKGRPTELLTNYFLDRVRGGVGLISTGICRVNNVHGVASPGQMSLVHNSNIKPFKKMTDKIHSEGGKIVVELHHPGRQNYSELIGNWGLMEFSSSFVPGFRKIFGFLVKTYSALISKTHRPRVVSASDVMCEFTQEKTRELKTKEVKKLIKDFVKAAVRAKKAGFDGVELHAAHGYILQQFLSPHTNKRKDMYGGSFENRFRMISEIIEGIRIECGESFPILVRLTVEEFYDDKDSITLELGKKIAKALEEKGIDAIDVSSASYEKMNKWLETVSYEPGWRKYLAAEIKKEVNIPVIAANLIRSSEQAAQQIADGVQDMIGMGRPFLADPEIVNKIKEGREEDIRRCISCCYCFESVIKNAWVAKPLNCAVNPELSLPKKQKISEIYKDKKNYENKKVLVVGGGPGGMQAALASARKGNKVLIIEKEQEFGGQLMLANKPPHKYKLSWCIEDMETQLKKLGVEIRFNTEFSKDVIEEFKPDKVVLAMGADPIIPPFKGLDRDTVYTFEEILSGKDFPKKAKKVAVIGSGMTGLETAELVMSKDKSVVIIEMADKIAPTAYHQHRDDALEELSKGDVEYRTSVKLVEILEKSIKVENLKTNKIEEIPVDAVILAIGSRPTNQTKKVLEELDIPFKVIGDATKIGRVVDAIAAGYRV